MNTIEEMDLKNKKVVLRCDFNVSIKDDKIIDTTKIKNAAKTINKLLEDNCWVVILSHLGRVKSEEDKEKKSLKIVSQALADILKHPVKFVNNCYGEKVKKLVDSCHLGEVILLENTRWMDYPEKLESHNDLTLAKFWASLGEVYLNDAFGTCHRAHASTAGIAKFLPHGVGFLVQEELTNLDILINNTPHPFTVFMGGAKVDDKLPIIESILPKCDYLLLGGGIANSFLKAKGEDVGSSLATDDADILKKLQELLTNYQGKIVLPIDFVIENGAILDLGEKTIQKYLEYVNQSAIVFMNGTCGKYEDEKFARGTKDFFSGLENSHKNIIIGGGDTLAAAQKLGFENSFNFQSTGGGATLEYIAYGKLEALDWMK